MTTFCLAYCCVLKNSPGIGELHSYSPPFYDLVDWLWYSRCPGSGERAVDSLDGRHVGRRHRAHFLGLLQRVLLVEGLLFFLLILDIKQRRLSLGTHERE